MLAHMNGLSQAYVLLESEISPDVSSNQNRCHPSTISRRSRPVALSDKSHSELRNGRQSLGSRRLHHSGNVKQETEVALAQQDITNGVHELVQRLLSDLSRWKLPSAKQKLLYFKQPPTRRWTASANLSILAYQGGVLSLIQASIDFLKGLVCQQDDTTSKVLQSLARLLEPLKVSLGEVLSREQETNSKWFWAWITGEAVPNMLVHLKMLQISELSSSKGLEGDKGEPYDSSRGINSLILAVHVAGALSQLTPSLIGCKAFSQTLTHETKIGLRELSRQCSLEVTYRRACLTRLQHVFFEIFGNRAAGKRKWESKFSCDKRNSWKAEEQERGFWVTLVEHRLQSGLRSGNLIGRWEKQATDEEVVRDLAIFGLFTALVHTSRSFLASLDVTADEKDVGLLLRSLEGAVVTFYPQLQNLEEYQHFLDIVCGAIGWLPFYPGVTLAKVFSDDPYGQSLSQFHGSKATRDESPVKKPQAILAVQLCCAKWMREVIKYGEWLTGSLKAKAAQFLRECLRRLDDSWQGCRVGQVQQKRKKQMNARASSSPQDCSVEGDRQMQGAARLLSRKGTLPLQLQPTQVTPGHQADQGPDSEASDWPEDRSISIPSRASPPIRSTLQTAMVDFGADAWRGTKLWSSDMVAASSLLRRGALGEVLSARDRRHLLRALLDLALVVPLGALLAIPITPLGHGAVLVALQRWMPALIPSSFGRDRLAMARQMEEMRALEMMSTAEHSIILQYVTDDATSTPYKGQGHLFIPRPLGYFCLPSSEECGAVLTVQLEEEN